RRATLWWTDSADSGCADVCTPGRASGGRRSVERTGRGNRVSAVAATLCAPGGDGAGRLASPRSVATRRPYYRADRWQHRSCEQHYYTAAEPSPTALDQDIPGENIHQAAINRVTTF